MAQILVDEEKLRRLLEISPCYCADCEQYITGATCPESIMGGSKECQDKKIAALQKEEE